LGRSEEQWKDLKMKLTVGVIIAVIGSCVYAIGPGLEKFVDYARDNKNTDWAPRWYYNVGRVYEATWREQKARAVYEDFWKHWSGDERAIPELATMMEDIKYEAQAYAFVPIWAVKHPDREWIGGPGAAPHPLMADILMRLSKMEEDKRNYQEARYYYSCVLYCFPSGTDAYAAADKAKKRDLSRGF
jgi:hypothetical protein